MRYLISVLVASFLVLVLHASQARAKCVDVEKASGKDLQALKGVGPKLAKAIVNYRKNMRTKATKAKKARWMFRNWATLMKVSGVGGKICKDNLSLVCFGGKAQKSCPR